MIVFICASFYICIYFCGVSEIEKQQMELHNYTLCNCLERKGKFNDKLVGV